MTNLPDQTSGNKEETDKQSVTPPGDSPDLLTDELLSPNQTRSRICVMGLISLILTLISWGLFAAYCFNRFSVSAFIMMLPSFGGAIAGIAALRQSRGQSILGWIGLASSTSQLAALMPLISMLGGTLW